MSWNLPSGAYQQPDENDGRSPQGDKTHSFSFKGLYDALQTAADTADSMKSRGYGLPGRTCFAAFRFRGRDAAALLSNGKAVADSKMTKM